MRKIEFLRYTGVILDHCPECSGFFLDGGDLERVNAALEEISGRERGEELREHRDGRLVTVHLAKGETATASFGATVGFSSPVGTTTILVSVYFKASLGVGLRVHTEDWTVKLARLFGLYRQADIETGNADFDKRFVLEAEEADGARRVLTPDAQRLLVEFAAAKHKLVLERGALQVLDDRLLYVEGPYAGELKTDVVAAAERVIAPLLAIAEAMEAE